MIDKNFEQIIQSNKGCVTILAGSESDKVHIEKIIESLNEFNIPYQVRICSAHKQPKKLMDIIKEYNELQGSIAFIAVAGGTDALSGTLSFHALYPTISCPPDAPNESCLTNPPGSSNAYIQNPKNIGKFVAQMYSGINQSFRKLLYKKNNKKIESLIEADLKFQQECGRK